MTENFKDGIYFRPPNRLLFTVMAWPWAPITLVGAFFFLKKVIVIWPPMAIAIIVVSALSVATYFFALGLMCLVRGVVIEFDQDALVVHKALSGRIAGKYRYEHIMTICRWRAGIETEPIFFLLYTPSGKVDTNWEDMQIVRLPYVESPKRFWKALNARIKQFAPRRTAREHQELQAICRRKAARYDWTVWFGLVLVLLCVSSIFFADWLDLPLVWKLGAILTPVIVGALVSAVKAIENIV